jgi:ATP-dependent protease ClpP protease subunit
MDETKAIDIKPFIVRGAARGIRYTVNIDETFVDTKQFDDVVAVLEEATEDDEVVLNLSTPGGAVHAVLPLLGAIAQTRCHVHGHAASDVASAGTFILLTCDSISTNAYVSIMCHQVQFGSGGPGNNVVNHVKHTMELSNRLTCDIYKDFFTESEIERMLSGTDFYMDDVEFMERCKTRNTIREAADSVVEEKE